MSKARLGDLLLEANLIDEVQLRIALEEQKRRGTKFGSTLIALNFIDETVLSAFLSRQLDMPCVSLSNMEISPRVLSRVGRDLAWEQQAVPIRLEREKLYVAMADPLDVEAIETIERASGFSVVPMIAPQSSIRSCLARHYPDPEHTLSEVQSAVVGVFPELVRELNEMDVFEPHFQKILERLDHLEERLDRIEALLLKGR